MTRIVLPPGLSQEAVDMQMRLAAAQQQHQEISNMHFTVGVNLFSRWASPADDEAKTKELATAAVTQASLFLLKYGIKVKFKAPDTAAELDGQEPDGNYVNQ